MIDRQSKVIGNMTNLADVNLNRLVVFVAVVETGSITAAAKRLGIVKGIVSAHLQRLEAEIGSSLVIRTTRRLHLTEAGQLFFQACQKILQDTELAISMASSNTQELKGKLRISASIDYSASVIAPIAAHLNSLHPELRIEIIASDNRLDMVAEGLDLAIRIGRLTDSSHKATLISHFEEWLVAPPALFPNGVPATLEELESVPVVGLTALVNPLHWTFTRRIKQPGADESELVSEALRFNAKIMANTSIAIKAAVMSGAGMMFQPDFVVRDDVIAGRLTRLAPEWTLPGGGIYAVFPATSQRSRKVDVFIAMLKEYEQRKKMAI
ncbi:MAG: LysR family transcriptional regulator [Moraxellaceae bacterium]|nr:MAG: LysR family transcriptional regulator [Moraxellaceae bacterium]